MVVKASERSVQSVEQLWLAGAEELMQTKNLQSSPCSAPSSVHAPEGSSPPSSPASSFVPPQQLSALSSYPVSSHRHMPAPWEIYHKDRSGIRTRRRSRRHRSMNTIEQVVFEPPVQPLRV